MGSINWLLSLLVLLQCCITTSGRSKVEDTCSAAPTPARGWESPTATPYKTTNGAINNKKKSSQHLAASTVKRKHNIIKKKHHHQAPRSHGQIYVTDAVIKAREEARNCARERSQLSDDSQVAWFDGDKGLAKSLSNQAKELGRKMDQANTKASKLILEGQDWMRSGELDLHGLFLREALAATHMFLMYWIRNRRSTVLIITGAGHHSKQKDQPVLRPKVVALLQERKLKFSRVHKNGALLVSLRPRQ